MAFVMGGDYQEYLPKTYYKNLLMMKMLYLLTAMAFMACQANPDQQEKKEELKEGVEKIGQDVKETVADAGDYFRSQRNEMKEELEERRKEIDLKMDKLEKDGSAKSVKARKRLEELRAEIDVKLEALKDSSAATWDSTRKGIDTFLKKSDREWTELREDFKELFR